MASSSDPPDDRKSPGHRKPPHSLSTSLFSKTRRGTELRSPTIQSPTFAMRRPSAVEASTARAAADKIGNDGRSDPIAIPSAAYTSSNKQKKLAPSNTFNTHYRSISRSMNDLGNIFSRGRSPPNREIGLRLTGGPNADTKRKGILEVPQGKQFEPGNVPSISVMQHGEYQINDHILYDGWINMIDSSIKKGSMRDAWKLHYAQVTTTHMTLYKPPSSYQIRAFDLAAGPASPQRPQSAPATASPTFNVSSLRHRSTVRHPELLLSEAGEIKGGTVEALCHELVFTQDTQFVGWAARSLSGWTGPETALSVLLELSALRDSSARIGMILEIIADSTSGLLLESGCYNCARMLAEKGINPHNPELARKARMAIENGRNKLEISLGIKNSTNESETIPVTISRTLTTDEFLHIKPEIFAAQVHLFHLKYFRAWSPANDISLLLISPHLPPPSHRNPLLFSTSSIHFLGDRVFDHVLCGDSVHSVARRTIVLSRWIEVGLLLKDMGDMVGFLAIMMTVLSPSILRLRETWSAIQPQYIDELEKTGGRAMRILERRRLAGQSDISGGQVFAPNAIGVNVSHSKTIPFFGDLLHCMDDAYASRNRHIDFTKMVQGLQTLTDSLSEWKSDWVGDDSSFQSESDVHIKAVDQIQSCLYFLNSSNQNPAAINSPVYFEKSLLCEPSVSGMYLQSHYHQKLPLSTGANIPLVFTDIRRSFSLFDRTDTLAISGNLHKKTPSSGAGNPSNLSTAYPAGAQPNQNLRPPTSHRSHTLRRTRSFPPSRPSIQTTGYDELDFTTRERTAVLHGGDNAMLRAIRDVAGVGQQLFYSKDGELVLKSITDESSHSRPSSVIETTSKRQSTASRRYSQIHSRGQSPRISLYADSNVLTTPVPDTFEFVSPNTTSLLVVPKGGTLERLVDILVLGVQEFSKRMNSSDKSGVKPRELRMDMDVFTITFFATFRSYCSPVVLLDYLKKRLLGSKSAASFSKDSSDDVVFPDWTGVDHVKEETIDWSLVAKIHLGILDAIDVWVSEFYMDFHCDQYLGQSFMSFLHIAAKEFSIWALPGPEKAHLKKQADSIAALWNDIKDKFSTLCFSPSVYASPSCVATSKVPAIPQPDSIESISEFIDVLDLRLGEVFRTIKLVDWMFAFETLEIQSAEPLGFFVPKVTLLSHEDDDSIQDIFFLLNNLRRANSHTTLVQSFPKSLRDICSLHADVVSWILSQVITPSISLEKRSQRIAALLKSLAMCRKRMSGMDLYDNTDATICRPVPSFVGSAIATALVRPESRMFIYAWQLGVKLVGGNVSQIETLEQVVPIILDGQISPKQLTPSAGWMIERLLEIICHVPNMVVENNRLINFDKRRYVYNFINNFTGVSDNHQPGNRQSSILSLKSSSEPFDARAIREAAYKENQNSKHGRVKIFWKLLQQEQDKVRRDAKQRETMERQQKNLLRAEHRRQPTAVRLDSTDKRGAKRLAVNSIFKAVRPISMAFTSGWTPPQNAPRIVPPSDLPTFKGVETGRKPAAIIDLRLVLSVTCPRKTRDQALWRITTSNGSSYLLQATSEKELDEWLKALSSVRGVTANDGTESIDLVASVSQNRLPQPVFGVSLEELSRRDNVKVPVIVEEMLTEIEQRGLSETGLYRVPGSLASINALKLALDSGEEVNMDDDRWYDINVIAGAFKLFMRDLPEQALSLEVLNELRNLTAEILDEEERVPRYREIMIRQAPHNYNFLRRVYTHFARVAGNAAVNKMHAVNLAIVFGMGLAPNLSNPFGISPDLGLYQQMVKTWITYADQIFPDLDEDNASSLVAQTESSQLPSDPSPSVSSGKSLECRSLR